MLIRLGVAIVSLRSNSYLTFHFNLAWIVALKLSTMKKREKRQQLCSVFERQDPQWVGLVWPVCLSGLSVCAKRRQVQEEGWERYHLEPSRLLNASKLIKNYNFFKIKRWFSIDTSCLPRPNGTNYTITNWQKVNGTVGKLNPNWITGFWDAEVCFTVNLTKLMCLRP